MHATFRRVHDQWRKCRRSLNWAGLSDTIFVHATAYNACTAQQLH